MSTSASRLCCSPCRLALRQSEGQFLGCGLLISRFDEHDFLDKLKVRTAQLDFHETASLDQMIGGVWCDLHFGEIAQGAHVHITRHLEGLPVPHGSQPILTRRQLHVCQVKFEGIGSKPDFHLYGNLRTVGGGSQSQARARSSNRESPGVAQGTFSVHFPPIGTYAVSAREAAGAAALGTRIIQR